MPFRALVRPASDGSDLAALGATTIAGDLRDRRSLDAAVAGDSPVIAAVLYLAWVMIGWGTVLVVYNSGEPIVSAQPKHAVSQAITKLARVVTSPAAESAQAASTERRNATPKRSLLRRNGR